MFDIGWSELVVIGVVALIAIGPKELPSVLRMVGQWMGKVRRMASDFQGQFQEAMREAEVADLKKQFDDISETTRQATDIDSYTSTNASAAASASPATPPSPESAPAPSEPLNLNIPLPEPPAAVTNVDIAPAPAVADPSKSREQTT